jgi:hypothetical protein
MTIGASFPNEASIVRLIGVVLFEQNDEWQTSSRYVMVEAFAQIDKESTRRRSTPFSRTSGFPIKRTPTASVSRLDQGRNLPFEH